jgi:hypothetical protein
VIIASWTDPTSHNITVQTFVVDGKRFIPIFSDFEHFRHESVGSGFEDQGVEIERSFLVSLLNGDELLVLNPGSTKFQFNKAYIQRKYA